MWTFVGIVFDEFSHDLSHVLRFCGALSHDMGVLSSVLMLAICEATIVVSQSVKESRFRVMRFEYRDDLTVVMCGSVLILHTSSEPDELVK